DRPETFEATLALAQEAGVTIAQFVIMTPFPGTVDFQRWEKSMVSDPTRIAGVPLTRYWLIPQGLRPKVYTSHPVMSAEEIRRRTQNVWDRFYSLGLVWKRSGFLRSLRHRLAFAFMSKMYRQMFANTGIATDSARERRAATWTRWIAKPCQRLFRGTPMPDLQVPTGY
ncbi:MAG: B12-binding domain-containing radical SAM protein, partial [Candidatus Acidiferrales bacterium]